MAEIACIAKARGALYIVKQHDKVELSKSRIFGLLNDYIHSISPSHIIHFMITSPPPNRPSHLYEHYMYNEAYMAPSYYVEEVVKSNAVPCHNSINRENP